MKFPILCLSLSLASAVALANTARPSDPATTRPPAKAADKTPLRTQVENTAAQLRSQSDSASQRFSQFTPPPMPQAAITLPPPPAPITLDLPATPANTQTPPKSPQSNGRKS